MSHITHLAFVGGSHGVLTVDKATGIIVDRGQGCDCEDCEGVAYSYIARFDPLTFAGSGAQTSFDVLGCGYWLHDGTYQEQWTIRSITGPIRLENGRVMQADEDFDDWVPFRLLSAPN